MKKKINNKYICIILARKGSKRIKNKNLVKINQKPLINYTMDAITKVLEKKNIYVSTNDERIIKITKKYKINHIKRPESLCKDTSTSEQGILHAIKKIKPKKEYKNIIFLQATSPLRNSNHIINCIKKYESKNLDSIFSAFEAKKFIWKKKGKTLKSLTFNFKKRERSQKIEKLIIENGAIFIFKIKKFLTYNNRICGKFDYFAMEENNSFDIDDIQDLRIVRNILK